LPSGETNCRATSPLFAPAQHQSYLAKAPPQLVQQTKDQLAAAKRIRQIEK